MTGKKKYILSIDDDDNHNMILHKYVNHSSCELVTTSTVEDFFKKCVTNKPDLILLDINLAEKIGAGYHVLKLIRKQIDQTIPIVVISRIYSENDIAFALDCGADDFIQKALDKISFLQKLNTYLSLGDDFVSRLPLFKITSDQIPHRLSVNLSLIEISENKLYLESEAYIAAGTVVEVKSEKLEEIIGQVKHKGVTESCKKNEDGSGYVLRVNISDEDIEVRRRVRSWIQQQAQS